MELDPREQPLPAWYQLGVKDAGTLLIRVHKSAMSKIQAGAIDYSQAPIVLGYQKSFNLETFKEPNEGEWGFGEVMTPSQSECSDWVAWECYLPVINPQHRPEEEKSKVFALRSTLSILFEALLLNDIRTESPLPQLMIIESMSVLVDSHGGSFKATITPALSNWLSQQVDESRLSTVEFVMRQAYDYMWPEADSRSRDYDVLC